MIARWLADPPPLLLPRPYPTRAISNPPDVSWSGAVVDEGGGTRRTADGEGVDWDVDGGPIEDATEKVDDGKLVEEAASSVGIEVEGDGSGAACTVGVFADELTRRRASTREVADRPLGGRSMGVSRR